MLRGNAPFDPPSLAQERPELGQRLGRVSGLRETNLIVANAWPQANENAKPRRGLIDGFVKTCERWRLSRPEQMILLGYPNNEIAATPVLDGRVRASQDVKDRTGYVLNISIGLAALFGGSIENEVSWLSRPHEALGQSSPMQKMLSGRMIDMIKVHELVLRERAL